MTPDERVEYISLRLTDHFGNPAMLHTPVILPDNAWDEQAPADATNLYRPFGWVPPFEVEVGRGEFWFCSQRIARQTTGLTDEELKAYIDIIQFVSDVHIVNYHVDDPIQRSHIADDKLLKTAPGSMDILNRVQLAVLDERES